MGTDKLKLLVGFVLSVVELVASVAGGISFALIGKLVEVARLAGPALGGAASALQQYIAMTDAEALDLENFVKADFDIADDKVEAAIELALGIAVQLHSLVAIFVKKPVA